MNGHSPAWSRPGWDGKVAQLLTLVDDLDRAALRTNSPAVADAIEEVHLALWAVEIDPGQLNPESLVGALIDLTSTVTSLPQFEMDLICTALCAGLCLGALWRGADISTSVDRARTHLDDAMKNMAAGS